MPLRIQQIKHWLENELQAEIQSFAPASNDASFRRYFRVTFTQPVFEHKAGQSFIVMDAPPEKENIAPFIAIASALAETGVNVPRLYAISETGGFILMADLGSTSYLSLLESETGELRADKLYTDAMNALVLMQLGMQQQTTLHIADYDEQQLRTEMNLLPQWYVQRHCQQTLTDDDQAVWEATMARLVASAQEQPQVFVHRDYHSRNLMYFAEHNPAIIDFQDALIGPLTYDLVSLLRDSYIAWPDERVYDWVEQYRQILLQKKRLTIDDKAQFIRWFDWMGIQRQLKVVGIFCRLNYRDGKRHYLHDIPQTLAYLFKVCGRYSEFTALVKMLKRFEAKGAST